MEKIKFVGLGLDDTNVVWNDGEWRNVQSKCIISSFHPFFLMMTLNTVRGWQWYHWIG